MVALPMRLFLAKEILAFHYCIGGVQTREMPVLRSPVSLPSTAKWMVSLSASTNNIQSIYDLCHCKRHNLAATPLYLL